MIDESQQRELERAALSELSELLRQSQIDQSRLQLHLRAGVVAGTVARLDKGTVELRDGSERVVVRLDRIEAIRRS